MHRLAVRNWQSGQSPVARSTLATRLTIQHVIAADVEVDPETRGTEVPEPESKLLGIAEQEVCFVVFANEGQMATGLRLLSDRRPGTCLPLNRRAAVRHTTHVRCGPMSFIMSHHATGPWRRAGTGNHDLVSGGRVDRWEALERRWTHPWQSNVLDCDDKRGNLQCMTRRKIETSAEAMSSPT